MYVATSLKVKVASDPSHLAPRPSTEQEINLQPPDYAPVQVLDINQYLKFDALNKH
jgi:hypothetical protein